MECPLYRTLYNLVAKSCSLLSISFAIAIIAVTVLISIANYFFLNLAVNRCWLAGLPFNCSSSASAIVLNIHVAV